jgi:hypothetical protein
VEVDALFTVTINLMWQLHYDAAEQGVQWLEVDLVAAIGELDAGPWRHLGATPDIQGMRFTTLCALLDALMDELGRRTPGLSARVALAQARCWLDPLHAS